MEIEFMMIDAIKCTNNICLHLININNNNNNINVQLSIAHKNEIKIFMFAITALAIIISENSLGTLMNFVGALNWPLWYESHEKFINAQKLMDHKKLLI